MSEGQAVVLEAPVAQAEEAQGLDITEATLPDASDEQLSQLLERATQELQEDSDSELAEEDPTEPQQEAETSEDEPAEEVQGDEKSEEDFVKVSAADWEKQQKQLEQKELFIQKRNTEVGQLRAQLKEAKAKLSQDLDELYEDNPREARDREKQIEKIDSDLQKVDAAQVQMNKRHQAEKAVSQFLQPDEFDPVGMAETAKALGLPQHVAEAISKDPHNSGATPMELVMLAKMNKGDKLVMQLASYAKQLQDKLDASEQAVKSAPNKVLSNLSKAIKSPPSVSAASGGASQTGVNSLDAENLAELSDEELEAAIAAG